MKDLCVVLPVHNEASILTKSVDEVRKVLDKTKLNYEIIIAEDGSTDRTYQIAKNIAKKYKNVKLIHFKRRLGRGKAVGNAFKKSKAKIVGFIDADLEVPATYIPALIQEIESGFDVVTGWRFYKFDWNYVFRIITSKIYSYLVKLLLNVNLKDTETGYKFFNRKSILPIIDEIEAIHWFWDTEIVVRSYHKGLKIKEVPVIYIKQWESKSKVNVIQDSIDYFRQLIKFRRKIKEMKNKRF